jgi:hypothetical protein
MQHKLFAIRDLFGADLIQYTLHGFDPSMRCEMLQIPFRFALDRTTSAAHRKRITSIASPSLFASKVVPSMVFPLMVLPSPQNPKTESNDKIRRQNYTCLRVAKRNRSRLVCFQRRFVNLCPTRNDNRLHWFGAT